MKNIILLSYFFFFFSQNIFAQNDNPKEYDGDWLNNKRHGQGKCIYWNGNIYQGQWLYNRWHGKGKLIFANGDVYEGKFEAGNITGSGTFAYKNGEKYTGHLVDGIYNGIGEKYFKNGNIYKGDWVDNLISGKGEMKYANGDIYTGYWFEGKKNDIGKYTSKTNDSYSGQWSLNKYDGSGEWRDAAGNIYKGDFVNGKRSGKGEWIGIGNEYYSGDWDRNKYNGFGSLTTTLGDKYTGHFKNGKYDGSGELKNHDGTIITGEFKNGKIEGTANIEKADGTKYYGEFNNGKYEGEGSLLLPNGDFYKGEFKNGKFNKYGILYYANGGYFRGGWWNGRRYGLGEEVDANGNIIEEGKYGGKKGKLLMTTAQMERAQVAQEELLKTMRGMQEQMAYQKKQQYKYQQDIAKRNKKNEATIAEYSKLAKARSKYLENVKAGKTEYDPEVYKNPNGATNNNIPDNTINTTNTGNSNLANKNITKSKDNYTNRANDKEIIKPKAKYHVGQQIVVTNKDDSDIEIIKGQVLISKVLNYDKYRHENYASSLPSFGGEKTNKNSTLTMEDSYDYEYILNGWLITSNNGFHDESFYNNDLLEEYWSFIDERIGFYKKGFEKINWVYKDQSNNIDIISYTITKEDYLISYFFYFNDKQEHIETTFSEKNGARDYPITSEREKSAILKAEAFLPNLFNYKSFRPRNHGL